VKLLLNGVEYDSVDDVLKAVNRAPVLHYIELQDQAKVNLDELDARALPWRTLLACWDFLLRRAAGEQVTFVQVAGGLIPDDVVLEYDDTGEDEDAVAPDPTPAGGEPSPT
jgi:hypothetical protein